MAQLIQNMQNQFKKSSTSLFLLFVKAISGLAIGLTLALIFEGAFAIGQLVFWFVILIGLFSFLKISQTWSLGRVLLFDLIFVLIAMLLRMYVLLGPG